MIKNTNKMLLSLNFEYLMSFLYGKKQYHGSWGNYNLSRYKEKILKINNAIGKAIKSNINVTDNFHKLELQKYCNLWKNGINSSTTFDKINEVNLIYLSYLIFILLGKKPNHWDRRVVNKKHDWKLDHYRNIFYYQSNEQKVGLILSLTDNAEYHKKLPEIKELIKILGRMGNAESFLSWFKEKYPKIYYKIF